MKIAITGLGGIGKTQLALEFVFQHEKQYPDCAVFWIPCVSSETIDQAYRVASRELGIPGHDDAQLNVKELLRDYLSSDKSGRWLLVFDNVDDLSVWEDKAAPSSRGLPDYLPKNDLGTIIFTTRDNKAAVKLASSNVINLSEMDESNSRQLLQNYLINKHLVKAEEDTKMLLKRLTYLPLAIVQAASFINMNHITLQDYICLLDEQETEQIERLNEDFDDDWRYQDVQNPVAKTWLISFTQIKQRDPLASDYLSFMACIDSKEIPKSLLPCPPGLPGKREVEAIGTLIGYSFITRHTTGNVFSMHRLVHISTRNWLRIEKTLDTWTDKAAARLADGMSNIDINDRARWRSCMPHAHYVLTMNPGSYDPDSALFDLSDRYGNFLRFDGRHQDAEMMNKLSVEVCTAELGADHPYTLFKISNLASVYEAQGRWDDAERLELQVMEARKMKLGADHPHTFISMDTLAMLYMNRGRWTEAEMLGVQVVEARKTKQGADHLETLGSMNNLTKVYLTQHRLDDAEKLGVQVLEAYKTKLGADHYDTLSSMNNLMVVYRDRGRCADAEKLGVQIVKASKAKLGADHPSTLSSMNNLALVYEGQERWDDAEKLEMQVIKSETSRQGADHPSTLASMSNLAGLYKRQGRWDDAEKLGMQVVEASKTKQGADNPYTIIYMSNLAILYETQSRWDDAEKLWVQVVAASKTADGADHPNTIIYMDNLASVYERQGRWDEAERLWVQVMEARKTKIGADHPDTLNCMCDIAIAWKELGRHADALNLIRGCVEASQRVLGPDHPDTERFTSWLDWLEEWEDDEEDDGEDDGEDDWEDDGEDGWEDEMEVEGDDEMED